MTTKEEITQKVIEKAHQKGIKVVEYPTIPSMVKVIEFGNPMPCPPDQPPRYLDIMFNAPKEESVSFVRILRGMTADEMADSIVRGLSMMKATNFHFNCTVEKDGGVMGTYLPFTIEEMESDFMQVIIEEGEAQGLEITDGRALGHYEKVLSEASVYGQNPPLVPPPITSIGAWIHTRVSELNIENVIETLKWCKRCNKGRKETDQPTPVKATVSFGKRDEFGQTPVGISEFSG